MKLYPLIPALLFFTATSASAKFIWADNRVYTPEPQDVITQTSINASRPGVITEMPLDEVAQLLKNSETVGNSEVNVGYLKRVLEQKFRQNPTTEVRYLYAKVLQKEHRFDRALEILGPQTNKAEFHVNSLLLKANLLMTKGQFSDAKQLCLRLLGVTSIEMAATCAIDADSHTGNAAQSYKELNGVMANKPMSLHTRHVLAELAFRSANPQQSLRYLQDIELRRAPISLVVLWADVNLALAEFDRVLEVLPQLVESYSDLEDALLLRLAFAEKRTSTAQQWQKRMAARVQLREQRQDTHHASDLALYYLDLVEHKEKARYWAEVNWQSAKLDQDRLLLQRVNEQFDMEPQK